MKDQLELIDALKAGKPLVNIFGHSLSIVKGNIFGTDTNKIRYPVKWLDHADWKLKDE